MQPDFTKSFYAAIALQTAVETTPKAEKPDAQMQQQEPSLIHGRS